MFRLQQQGWDQGVMDLLSKWQGWTDTVERSEAVPGPPLGTTRRHLPRPLGPLRPADTVDAGLLLDSRAAELWLIPAVVALTAVLCRRAAEALAAPLPLAIARLRRADYLVVADAVDAGLLLDSGAAVLGLIPTVVALTAVVLEGAGSTHTAADPLGGDKWRGTLPIEGHRGLWRPRGDALLRREEQTAHPVRRERHGTSGSPRTANGARPELPQTLPHKGARARPFSLSVF